MLKKINDYVSLILDYMTIPLFILMFCTVLLQVFARFFDKSYAWTEEISGFSFIIFAFIGIVTSMKRGQTNTIEFVVQKFHGKVRAYISLVNNILILFFCAFMIKTSITWVNFGMLQKSSILKIPMGILYITVPVLFFFLGLLYLQHVIEGFKSLSER